MAKGTDNSGHVFQTERQAVIVELAMVDGRVDVASLAKRFDVTTETVRRDLDQLQTQRLVRRVHGGAIPWEQWRFEPRLSVRDSHNPEQKRRIARRALDELPSEGTILIDSGSTAAHVAALLPRDATHTVVTNSLPVVNALAQHKSVEIIVIGGLLKKDTMAMVDSGGVAELAGINVDLLFTSADGFSVDRGFTTPYREEAAIKQAMMGTAQRTLLLVDDAKLGKDYLHQIAAINQVDAIVTGSEMADTDAEALEARGTVVLRA
ncbi:MAG: DeoR/GlpR family DNA-binding transcription regulator [Acidimicrobiia bacterium]